MELIGVFEVVAIAFFTIATYWLTRKGVPESIKIAFVAALAMFVVVAAGTSFFSMHRRDALQARIGSEARVIYAGLWEVELSWRSCYVSWEDSGHLADYVDTDPTCGISSEEQRAAVLALLS